MATLKQQLEKGKQLESQRISDALFKFIKSIESEIVDINKKQLNQDSQDIDGKPIGFYSRATEIITGGEKAEGQPFDAEDTGDFLKGFYIEIRGEMVYFNSRDPKTGLILGSDNWLSSDLFGLQDDNLRQLIKNRLLPFVLTHIRGTLNV